MLSQEQLLELFSHRIIADVETRINRTVGPSHFLLLDQVILRLRLFFLLLVKFILLGSHQLLFACFEFFLEVLRGQIFAQLFLLFSAESFIVFRKEVIVLFVIPHIFNRKD